MGCRWYRQERGAWELAQVSSWGWILPCPLYSWQFTRVDSAFLRLTEESCHVDIRPKGMFWLSVCGHS